MKLERTLLSISLCLVVIQPASAAPVRLKDLISIEGVRENQLVGYGLVVGLAGTGDKQTTIFTTQSLANLLARMGVAVVNATSMRVANVASVMVTAMLPAFADPGVKIDVADVSVPVGKYTRQMLDQMARDPAFGPEFEKKFLANIVSQEENVKSVLSKIRLGEADAGVVYVTDVTPDAAKDVASLDLPDQFNQIASYPIAVITKSSQPDLAAKFENYVLSSDGQEILRGYNFIPALSNGH